MDKIIHVCDHCGKELTAREYEENTHCDFLHSGYGKMVFCDDCLKGVDKILKKLSEKRAELKVLNDELDDYITNFSRKEVESE